ncbi:MAG TPA: ABC transporter permease [Gaiellaceae bacterium]|nr:ABC transporter permease [Gaiellaceae bacterium]
MSPFSLGAWRLVLRRARHDRLVVAAAFLTILLATTLLASGPIYAEAVAASGLQRTLEDAPVQDATVSVSGQVAAEDYEALDEQVTRAVRDVFGADAVDVHRSSLSGSYTLPSGEGIPAEALTVFGTFDGLEEHADLVVGEWPAGGGGADEVEAVLSEPAARALGLAQGDTIEVAAVGDEDETVAVRLAGLYRVKSSDDPYWWGSPLELGGQEELRFTTFGPLVVSPEAFAELAGDGAEARWRAEPDTGAIGLNELGELRERLGALEDELHAEGGPAAGLAVQTGLGGVLERADRSLLVSRSGVLVPSVQLAVLAGAALLFLAGLLAERRAVEAAILRSRGASAGEVGQLALREGALLAIPSILAAPWLAALSLRAMNHIGPLADIGLELEPNVSRTSYALAAVAGILSALGLALPALRSAAVTTAVQEQGRPRPAGIVRRAGLDLVLVALAVLAYWQLRRYEGTVVESIQGRLGIDPLLVAAPALGLLAGALLALRVVPAVGAVAGRAATAARGLIAPLGTWQIARRPTRYARVVVLLTLALAIGLFASAYGSTWLQSQEDRATYEAGADIRVAPDELTGAIPTLNLAAAYGDIDGVQAALPVVESPLGVSSEADSSTLLAVDASRAAEIVEIRPDLADTPLSELATRLAAKRPELAALELPGTPDELTIRARGRVEVPEDNVSRFGLPRTPSPPSLAVVLRDGEGLLHRIPAGELPADGEETTLTVDVASEGRRPSYPLSLVAVELRAYAGFFDSRPGTFELGGIAAGPADVEPGADVRWAVDPSDLRDAQSAPEVHETRAGRESLLELSFDTGASTAIGEAPVTFTITPGQNELPQAIPAVATSGFLETTGTDVGGTVALGPADPELTLVGSVRGFPTLPPEEGGVVVDLPTYLAAVYLATGELPRPTEWLLDAEPGRERAVAQALLAPPYSSAEVVDRVGVTERLTRDPVALGISGALSLGFVAAAVFAVLGFAVSAAVSTSERTTEFAVLRSLGLSSRQLSAWLALEGGITVVLALVGGIVLGGLVAWLVLPFVSLAGEGGRPFPEVVVELPWEAVALLAGSLFAVLALVVGIQLLLLRRLALAPALRAGETR